MSSLVTKLLLGHALVLEALLPHVGLGDNRPHLIHADEAELRGQGRSQAEAWERGSIPDREFRIADTASSGIFRP